MNKSKKIRVLATIQDKNVMLLPSANIKVGDLKN